MTTQARPRIGYWAAYYINRDGSWGVACDALGRIIRCETKTLALSVARYRRRRLQPLRGGNPKLARTERRRGKDFTASPNGHPQRLKSPLGPEGRHIAERLRFQERVGLEEPPTGPADASGPGKS